MNAIWQAVTWNIARTGGFTTYILLTLSIVVGLALSMPLQSPSRWPRLVNNTLHNFLTLLSGIFLVVHVLAVWVDPFTHFGWNDVFLPFVDQYHAPWMALGIVALYLGIAVGITTWLRSHIGYALWRRLHFLTFAIYVFATAHGIGTGSDTQTTWGLAIYLVSIALVGSLLCRRIFISAQKRKQHPTNPPVRRASTVVPPQSAYRPNATGIKPNDVQFGYSAEHVRNR
jgi:predicted ferric reductase